MVREYRFEQACGSIATELLSSGRMALVQQGTVEIHLECDGKGLHLRRTTDEAIPVDRHYFTFSKRYKEIDEIEVDGKKITRCTILFTPEGVKERVITLKFREKFHKIPLGLL